MARSPTRILLLSGRPGVGKTTVIRRVAREIDRPVAGFYTEEIRDEGVRKGFWIVGFGGRREVMAHVDRAGEPRVSRYGVDVGAVDRAVARLPDPVGGDAAPGGNVDEVEGDSMPSSAGVPLFVVDEIGKMECLSERFVAKMRAILDSEARLVATVARRGGGFIAEVKEHPEAEGLEVTRRSRDRLPGRILGWLGG